MWTEKQKNGKYQYVERYINPHTDEEMKLSLTHEKNTKAVEKNDNSSSEEIEKKISEHKMDHDLSSAIENLSISI